MTSEELLRKSYKYFDYKMYMLCREVFKKNEYLELELIFIELYTQEESLVKSFFASKNISKNIDELINIFYLKNYNFVHSKPSKYLLSVFFESKKIAQENNILIDISVFLVAIINTKNPISDFFSKNN